MRGDECLPPGDRQEEPDPTGPETATERIRRICWEHGWTITEPGPSVKRKRSRLSGVQRIDAIMRGLDPDEPGSDG